MFSLARNTRLTRGVLSRGLCRSRALFAATEESTQAAAEPSANAATEASDAGSDDKAAANPLETELQSLRDDLEGMQKKYMLGLAEMENVRAIARRDVDNARTFAINGFAKRLLDVADNLTRATESVPAEELEEGSALKSLYDGVTLTDAQLQKVLTAHGVVKVSG